MNEKVYIHEYVDIIGPNRARYMHHMTANWSPGAQEDRHQLCYGVWGVVGSTGRWPQVVNIWEEDGFDGLATSLRGELSNPDLQDPTLKAWWARAAEFRSGGVDRLLLPAPWMPTVEEACAAGIRGEVYAHEEVSVPAGAAADYLEAVRAEAAPELAGRGWTLAGAWRVAMADDDACVLLWAVATWERWAAVERAVAADGLAWTARHRQLATGRRRILLVDAELCPFRTGRQPSRADRTEPWDG